MTPTTSEAQRAELHKTIWPIPNDLRGSVDGWDFKSYVFGKSLFDDLTVATWWSSGAQRRPGAARSRAWFLGDMKESNSCHG